MKRTIYIDTLVLLKHIFSLSILCYQFHIGHIVNMFYISNCAKQLDQASLYYGKIWNLFPLGEHLTQVIL